MKAVDPSTGEKRSLAGLVKRRAAEGELFLKQVNEARSQSNEKMPQKVAIELEMVIKQYKVNARSGLRVRAGAGTGFDILATLPLNKSLSIGKEVDNWVEVNLEGDGVIDG